MTDKDPDASQATETEPVTAKRTPKGPKRPRRKKGRRFARVRRSPEQKSDTAGSRVGDRAGNPRASARPYP